MLVAIGLTHKSPNIVILGCADASCSEGLQTQQAQYTQQLGAGHVSTHDFFDLIQVRLALEDGVLVLPLRQKRSAEKYNKIHQQVTMKVRKNGNNKVDKEIITIIRGAKINFKIKMGCHDSTCQCAASTFLQC